MMLLELNPEFPKVAEFPKMQSSRAALTLGSTRAGGHDDGIYHKLPQMNEYIYICMFRCVHTVPFQTAHSRDR